MTKFSKYVELIRSEEDPDVMECFSLDHSIPNYQPEAYYYL